MSKKLKCNYCKLNTKELLKGKFVTGCGNTTVYEEWICDDCQTNQDISPMDTISNED